MSHIGSIQFNGCMYEQAKHWTLLLYQLTQPSAVILLPNADLMSFIRVFDNTTQCQNHINSNSDKVITLFGHDENMQSWLASHIDIPNNLKSINIFCSADDYCFVDTWKENHQARLSNTTFRIITFDELNHELLSFGIKYLKELREQLKNDSTAVLDLLYREYEKICETLGIGASERATTEYQNISKGEEVRS